MSLSSELRELSRWLGPKGSRGLPWVGEELLSEEPEGSGLDNSWVFLAITTTGLDLQLQIKATTKTSHRTNRRLKKTNTTAGWSKDSSKITFRSPKVAWKDPQKARSHPGSSSRLGCGKVVQLVWFCPRGKVGLTSKSSKSKSPGSLSRSGMTPVELEGQLHSLSDGDRWTESHEELVVPVGGGAEGFEVALNTTRAAVEMSTAETNPAASVL